MNAAAIIKEVRRQLGDVLGKVGVEDYPEFSNKEILEGIESAAAYLTIAELGDDSYQVDVAAETITPEPSTFDGLLLATKVAADILRADISRKIRQGVYGVRFRTALNEVSTVEASRHIDKEAESLQKQFEKLVVMKISRSGTSRRLQ